MADSIGRRLLRRIGLAPDARRDPTQPAAPTAEELRAARVEVEHGGISQATAFLELLMLADREAVGLTEAAEEELWRLTARGWLTLDLVTRRTWWSFPQWWREAVERAASSGSPVSTTVASFHPNGRIREAATALLAEMDIPITNPALALRCADWVQQVRDRARVAILQRLDVDLVATAQYAGPVAHLAARRSRRQADGRAEHVAANNVRLHR